MKRLLLLIALLPGIACAAQQNINYTSTVKWNVVGPVIQSNFTELYTNKADKTSFASQSAFTTAWGWNPGGGVSAWSDIQALLTGDGDWVKRDGSTGTPIGTLPTGTDGQTIQYDSSGAPAAVDLAPLAFTDNVSRNTTTGVVSVPVTATTTSGSAVPFTSGGAYTALAGKQSTLVSGTNIKTINNTSLLGSGNIDIAGGTGGYVALSAIPYSDVACTTGQYGKYGSTAYLCTDGFWTSKWTLTTHSNPTPVTYSLTITPSGFTGADKFTYNYTDYTTEQVISGLSADASFTVTPDTGHSISCTGTGLTDNTVGSYTANTDTANVAATCTSSSSMTCSTTPVISQTTSDQFRGFGDNITIYSAGIRNTSSMPLVICAIEPEIFENVDLYGKTVYIELWTTTGGNFDLGTKLQDVASFDAALLPDSAAYYKVTFASSVTIAQNQVLLFTLNDTTAASNDAALGVSAANPLSDQVFTLYSSTGIANDLGGVGDIKAKFYSQQ